MSKRIRVCLIAVTFFLALATVWAVLPVPGTALAKKPDKDPGNRIPVTVTFWDDDSVRIQSDGGGTYFDSASIGRAGKFSFAIGGRQKPNEPDVRMLSLDFSDCFSVPVQCTPPLSPSGLFAASPGSVNLSIHGIDLTEMFPGEFSPAGMNLNIDLTKTGGGYWTLRWALDFENCPDPGSLPVTVTRTAADTWEIEAFPDDLACLGEIVGGKWEFRGFYSMPFLMTVVCEDPSQCLVAP